MTKVKVMTLQGTAYDPEILPLLERAFDERKKSSPCLFLCQTWHFNEKTMSSRCLSRRRVDR